MTDQRQATRHSLWEPAVTDEPGVDRMRRILLALFVAGLMLAASPSGASAWQNGETRDAFGTHDWILHHAMELAGEDASWIDRGEALLASDDPDNWRDDYPVTSLEYRLEQPRHLYIPDTTKQGAPQAVTDYYALMVRALADGDTVTASRQLGVISHYYSDLLVPFHASSYGSGSLQDGVDHRSYESAIGRVTRAPDAHPEWISPLPRRPMTDVRARAIEAATLSGSKALGLIGKYGTFEYYDPAADTQSQQLLNRAANDLADLIRSARTGSGQPRRIASIEAWADYYYPALKRPSRVWIRVKDDRGRVVRGAKVSFDFQVTQPCSYVRYTDADGVARQTHQNVLGSLGVPFNVVVTASSAGTTLKKNVVLVPTEVIGAGSRGIRTYIKSDATPAQGTVVTAVTNVRNDAGKPIRGIKVALTFKHKSRWVKKTVYTDANGNATWSRNIGNSRVGYRTYVTASAYGGTEPQNTFDGIRSSSASFVPHSKVASLKTSRLTAAKPAQSTKVVVRARCLDDHGKPIVGRTVKFSWKHKGRTVRTYAKTDANGNATTSRNIGKSKAGFKVKVTASISSGSKVKKSAVSFTPVAR